MQDRVIHAVQSRPHFLYRPDGALLRGLLGAVHGNRTLNQDSPLHGILERCSQQPVHLMDSRAGKKPLFLLFGQFLLLSLDIRTAGRFAQGRIEVFHVVGLELLRLHAADTAGRHGTGERSHGEPSRPHRRIYASTQDHRCHRLRRNSGGRGRMRSCGQGRGQCQPLCRPFLYTVHAVVGSLQFQLTIKMR